MSALLVLAIVLALLLAAAVEGPAIIALLGVATGERIGRCRRCHRYGLTCRGVVHGEGCPDRHGLHLPHSWPSLHRHLEAGHFPLRHH